MRYLRLSADYLEPSLVDPQSGRSTAAELGLSEALSRRIEDWNERYQRVIALTMPERAAEEIRSAIASLDVEGLELARDIVAQTPGWAKVEYFSEGLLKLLVGEGQTAPSGDELDPSREVRISLDRFGEILGTKGAGDDRDR